MEPIEIIVIIVTVLFVSLVLGNYIYRRIHHLPTGECACCHKKGSRLLKQYHKKYGKK